MRSSRAHSGASGRLMTSSSVFATNRLARSVHTSSGSASNSCGPGCRPYPCIAARMTAAVAVVGRPIASSGTSVPAADALFAASGPATPSIAPWPNSARCSPASRRSVMYDRNVGISAPPAGSAPNGNP